MEKVQVFQIMTHLSDKIDSNMSMIIHAKLEEAPDSVISQIFALPMCNVVTTILFSIFLGAFGVDRFYVKDTALGVWKLVLGAGGLVVMFFSAFAISPAGAALGYFMMVAASIWSIVDIFLCYRRAKVVNTNRILALLGATTYGQQY